MDDNDLLTITEAAHLTRAPVATLRYWRHLGIGPRSFRLGRRFSTAAPTCRAGSPNRSAPRPTMSRKPMSYTEGVAFLWSQQDATYIRTRSQRYPGALDIDPDWTQEVLADERLVELAPYPTSRVGASGFVGWSRSADRVLVVIAYRDLDDELHGLNVWPATGRDLATYNQGSE